MRALLTGFAPFPGVPVNASMRLVRELEAAAKGVFPDTTLSVAVLPTEWLAAPRQLEILIEQARPDLLLHFGVSNGARGFELELRGQNRCVLEPDAAGSLPAAEALDAGGPEVMRVTVPVARIVFRLRQRGIPAFLSHDAGGYLCNATLYHSLAKARHAPGRRVGFIHIPAGLANPATNRLGRASACPLTWSQAIDGGLEILAACLNRSGLPARPR